ncbi:hypothetical protein TWF281_010116 [Arthrobotrys megalospora]
MPNRPKQQFLADPHLSFKSVRFGDKPITPRLSSTNDQSTLSQFGFMPTSSSANAKKKKRTLVAYKNSGTKRKSLNFDDLKHESSEGEEEEDGDPVGKRRRVGHGHRLSDEDGEDTDEIKEEVGDESFVVNDQFDEDDEESWRPIRSPKRRKSPPKRKKFSIQKTRDRTLTQMYPLTHIPSESEYEEEGGEEESQEEYEGEESQEEDLDVPVEDIRIKDEPISQAAYEPDMQIKDEPQSQPEIPEDPMLNQYFKQEDEDIRLLDPTEPIKQENPADEITGEPSITTDSEVLGLQDYPKTPNRPIPAVIPSSYTPPVTPLSPLRHQQLSAILASPSIQRQWRMSGRKLPGFTVPDLSPVTEHQKKVDGSSTEENTPVEPEVPVQPPKRPDFTKDSAETDALSGASTETSAQREPGLNPRRSGQGESERTKPRVVQSTQWWEREETFTSNSANTLEPIQEVDSQPEVQVRSSDAQNKPIAPIAPAARQPVRSGDIEVVPESPVRRKNSRNTSFKSSFSTSMSREPLLRDSSGLHTIVNTSFFRKESSTIEPPPKAVDNESQRSEVSIKSVDRQLMNESDDYKKASADRVEETQLNTDELDPDATISQSLSKDLEATPRAPVRRPALPTRKGSHIPLLPPSSPPQTYRFAGNINSTPPSSKDIFHSPSSKISSSPIMDFKNTVETFEPQEEEGEGSNEGLDTSESYIGKGPVETITQWKMRMFGPSQAVPTISQILGANNLVNGAEDDEDEDDEEL